MSSVFGGKSLTGAAGGVGAGVSGLSTADGGTALADNAIVRGDGTTGIQGSVLTIADTTGNIQGPSGGFTITGGTASGDDLTLTSTTHATKGYIRINGFNAGIGAAAANELFLYSNDVAVLEMYGAVDPMIRSASQYTISDRVGVGGAAVPDTGFARSAATVARITNGSTGIGSLLTKVLIEANTAGSGAPNVLTANESRTVLTNEGTTAANYHTLPTAAAGYVFEFIVQDADGLRVVANTGDTIRVIDKVTATAGYIESTTIGSVVRLVAINATEWYATSVHGVWTDGTWTYDDTGNTSP